LIHNAKISYWREQFADTDNSKKFWQVVNNAQGIGTRKPIPSVYDSDSNILTNDFDKAEAMNDYFASIGTQLAEKFDHDVMTTQPFVTIYRITPTINQIGLSEKQVKLKLSRIKQKTGVLTK